jgi:hypothetical protein
MPIKRCVRVLVVSKAGFSLQIKRMGLGGVRFTKNFQKSFTKVLDGHLLVCIMRVSLRAETL